MIYYFTGKDKSGNAPLGAKLHKFLQAERRNWRRDVFYIDGELLQTIFKTKNNTDTERKHNINIAHGVVEFIHSNGCDIVVVLDIPYLNIRESFKEKLGKELVEIYTHSSSTDKNEESPEFIEPESNFIDINTTRDSINTSFSKLINNLNKLEEL